MRTPGPRELVSLSKLLSLVLRHRPQLLRLTLDDAGWVEVDRLLAALARHGRPLSPAELRLLVAGSDKQRFALSEDGLRIRANQGHSVAVDLGLAPGTPPDILYHGTGAGSVEAIREQGLDRRRRHHVHLSADASAALAVGARHGAPVVLRIDARRMAAAGHLFFRSDNGVWLVDHVPPGFIEIEAAAR